MRITIAVYLALALPIHAARHRAVTPPGATTWSAALSLSKANMQTIGTNAFASSSKLTATWTPLANIDHYILTATETAGGTPLEFSAAGTKSTTTLMALASATEYNVTIKACLSASCNSPLDGGNAMATTDEEFWQVRGSGSSFATADKIVPDGNTKPYALLWGADAGAGLAGKAQLYYDPMSMSEKGVKIGTMNASSIKSANDVAAFTPLAGYGFHRNDALNMPGTGPSTFQVVALSKRTGQSVRLFYEAQDADGHARVYSIDSQDGWSGRDFNQSAATICQDSDVTASGDCAPHLEIGVASDGNAHVSEARQLKVGLPTLDNWTWDGEAGTFMIVTLHFADSVCTNTFFNAGIAIWGNARWTLEYDTATGCPKLIKGAQAPMPVHVGGKRYKLYFSYHADNTTQLKPMKLLYANAANSGNPDGIQFDDWDPIARARRVNFLWPSGTLLTEEEKSFFDDYQIWMPANDPALQVMYSNMSCPNNGCGAPFIGMATLVNP
jgi:hypothetical protein